MPTKKGGKVNEKGREVNEKGGKVTEKGRKVKGAEKIEGEVFTLLYSVSLVL